MQRLVSRLGLCCLLAAAFVVLPARDEPAVAATWTEAPADASSFVASVNAARQANGLAPLTVDASMSAAALGWTGWMADNDTLQHSGDIISGAPADWTKVGENVGRGGSVNSVWNAFMASPSHAANVLDPAYTRVGIAVVWTAEGKLYTTHRFAGAQSDVVPAPTPVPEPEPTPEPEPDPEPDVPAPTPDAPDPTSPPPAPDPGQSATPPGPTAAPAAPTAEPAAPASAPPLGLAFGEPVPPIASADRIAVTMTVLLDASG